MILYDLRCRDGHRFEAALATMSSPNPPCPACDSATSRVPRAARLGGSADPGPSREQMPRSWRGVNGGDPDTVAGWRGVVEKRERLESRYPELAGDRRPVLAHEGVFAGRPLRAGDDVAASLASAAQAATASTKETSS